MLPILLNLGFIKIYTFGVFLVLAFFWGCYLLWKLVRLTAFKEEDIFDGLFISLIGGLFIGRLLHVITHFSDFGFDVLKFILINGYPGISMYGLLFGSFISFYLYTLAKKIQFNEIVDYIISPLFISMGIIKLGSFFAGVEVGSKTKFLLAIKYVGFDGLRHMTALYESILFFIAAYVSYKILFSIRREKYSHGFLFMLFVWFFSIVAIIFDSLKATRDFYFDYSSNVIVSFILLLTISIYFIYYFRSKIMGLFKNIINYLKHNGYKAFKKIFVRDKGKVGEGEKKND